MKLIDKDAVLEKIKKRLKEHVEQFEKSNVISSGIKAEEDLDVISCLDTLEVKEVIESEQPEYSCFETIYQCGKKPRWNIGDTLAYYEFYSDREGEYVLGKVTKVDFDKEQCDWFYTLENGCIYDEQSLLEEKTYKKN